MDQGRPFWKNGIFWIVVVCLAVGGVFLFLYLSPSTGCPEMESPETIPQQFENAIIKFQGATAYYDTSGGGWGCTPTLTSLKGTIWSLDAPPGPGFQPVSSSTSFKIVKRIYVGCGSNTACDFMNIDSGPPGDVIVVQDEQGNDWRLIIPAANDPRQQGYDPSYYINGQQAGYVTTANFN